MPRSRPRPAEPEDLGYYWIRSSLGRMGDEWYIVEKQKPIGSDREFLWWQIGSEIEYSWAELQVEEFRFIKPPRSRS